MSLAVSERQAVQFARGYKTWSENTALSVRRRLGLHDTAPLPPRTLAEDLDVVVWYPAEVPGLAQETDKHLSSARADEWSAVTVRVGSQDAVVLNPTHSDARQASDLTHELAHIIRGHTPTRVVLFTESGIGIREFNPLQEAEANWLAGCLLLPRPALGWCASKKIASADACEQYGVSTDLFRYRMQVTGVARQFAYRLT